MLSWSNRNDSMILDTVDSMKLVGNNTDHPGTTLSMGAIAAYFYTSGMQPDCRDALSIYTEQGWLFLNKLLWPLPQGCLDHMILEMSDGRKQVSTSPNCYRCERYFV